MATDSIAIINAVFPANARKYGLSDPRIQAELQTGFIEQYSGSNPGDCAKAGGYTPTGTAVTQQASVALGTAVSSYGIITKLVAAAAPIPIVGQVIAGIAAIALPLIGGIFKAHEQAVAREQGTLCALIPQVNKTLSQVDAAVAAGDIDVATADDELEQMVQNFNQDTSAITQDSGSTCNAGCVMRAVVRAEADIHEQKYHNSPLYYLKRYWWIGAIVLAVFLFRRK